MSSHTDDLVGERFGSGADAADERGRLAQARRDPALELCALDADSDLVDVSTDERGRVHALVGRDVEHITVYARAADEVVPVARYVVSAAMLEPSRWRPAPARRTLARRLDNGRVLRLSLGPAPDGVEDDDGVVCDAIAVDVALSPTLAERVRALASAIRRPRVRVAVRAAVGLFAGAAAFVVVGLAAMWLFLGGRVGSPPGRGGSAQGPSGRNANQTAATNTTLQPSGNANRGNANRGTVTNVAPGQGPKGTAGPAEPGPQRAAAAIPGLTTRQSAAVRAARDKGRLEVPVVSGLTSTPAATLSPGAGSLPAQLEPVARIVRGEQVSLSWSAVDKASAYVVSVYDTGAPDVAYDRSPRLTATSWTNGRPLERGRTYRWSVEAIRVDGDRVFSPMWARIRVLDPKAHAELTAAEQHHPNDRVMLGILYARVGLIAEARAHFTAAIDAGAERELATRLRDELDLTTGAAPDEPVPPKEETP